MSEVPLSEQFGMVVDHLELDFVAQGKVTEKLETMERQVDLFLEEGFNKWYKKDQGIGNVFAYRRNKQEGANFTLTDAIFSGQRVNRQIEGDYLINGIEIKVKLFQEETASPTIRIYINNIVVVEEIDIPSESEKAINEIVTAMSGEESEVESKRNDPRSLALKMLTDLEASEADNELSRFMFNGFREDGKDVEWAS